jgi:hypothetical protein
MTSSQSRRESAWKSRKQNQEPHGKIKSLAELSDESPAGVNNLENNKQE